MASSSSSGSEGGFDLEAGLAEVVADDALLDDLLAGFGHLLFALPAIAFIEFEPQPQLLSFFGRFK